MSYGVRRIRALDDHTQLVVIGVGGALSPARFDAPHESLGVVAREHPAVGVGFSVGYFSDEISVEECVRGAVEEFLASPLWRDADARLLAPGDGVHPSVVDLGALDDVFGLPDDARWLLWIENTSDEATLMHGRLVPREGDTYDAGRVRTARRATEEGEVLRVIGIPLASVQGEEPLVALRYDPQRGTGQAWTRDADNELREVLSGSYQIADWLLAPAR